MHTIQLEEDVPAVCKNWHCSSYKAFELYTVYDVKKDGAGREYIKCYDCGNPIFLA